MEWDHFVPEVALTIREAEKSLQKKAASQPVRDALLELQGFREMLDDLPESSVLTADAVREGFWLEFDDYWTRMQSSTESPLRRHATANPIAWGFWSLKNEEPILHGYSEKHLELIQSMADPSGYHRYRDKPGVVKWDALSIEQAGAPPIYFGSAPIVEIDAVSSVPMLGERIRTVLSSDRVLNLEGRLNQWQRRLDPIRIGRISEFLDGVGNSFANAVMLYMPSHPSARIEDAGGKLSKIVVDFQFLKEHRRLGGLSDHTDGGKDLRPLQIVDGQHRIRGGMRSERGHKLQVPFIVFPPAVGSARAAKYFAEINTQAESLNRLQELFMRHRFKLPSAHPALRYDELDARKKGSERGRANRLAYEAAAHCNIHCQALEQLIRMLEENPENNHIMSVDLWVKHAYSWFVGNGPYADGSGLSDRAKCFAEIQNFFDAFESITNAVWPVSQPRWLQWDTLKATDSSGKKPYIQYRTTFRALMQQLPRVVASILMSEGEDGERPISRELFEQYLQPLAGVDWLSPEVKSLFLPKGGGEYAWQCLAVWMADTLDRGPKAPYSTQEIHAEDKKSVRGKGLLSPPKKSRSWIQDGSPEWPRPDAPLVIVSERPLNAHPHARARLEDVDGEPLNEAARMQQSRTARSDRLVRFTIHHGDWCRSMDAANFSVTWGNAKQREVVTRLELGL